MIRNILLIAIGFFGAYLLFNGCNGAFFGRDESDTVKIEIDTLIVKKDTTIFKQGKDIFHERIMLDSVFVDKLVIDTLLVIEDYHAVNKYVDTLHLPDSSGYVIVIDTITKNELKGRQYDAQVKKSIITKTITIADKKRNSLMVGASINQMMIPEISAIYGGKSNVFYKVGYSSQGINAGIYYRLSFKPKISMLMK